MMPQFYPYTISAGFTETGSSAIQAATTTILVNLRIAHADSAQK